MKLTRSFAWMAAPWLAAGLLVWPAATVSAQAPLRWRLAEAERLQLDLTQSSNTEAEIGGKVFKSSLEISMTLDWRVVSVDEEGSAGIEQALSRLIVAAELPEGESFRFDSTSSEPPRGQAKAVAEEFQPLLKRPSFLRLTARGEIADTAPPASARPRGRGGETALPWTSREVRTLLGRLSPPLPLHAVQPGDAWQASREHRTTEGQIRVESRFVARGPHVLNGQTFQRIDATYALHLGNGTPDPDIDFPSQNGSGVFHFDDQAGRLLRGEIRQAVTLRLAVDQSQIVQKANSVMRIEVRSVK